MNDSTNNYVTRGASKITTASRQPTIRSAFVTQKVLTTRHGVTSSITNTHAAMWTTSSPASMWSKLWMNPVAPWMLLAAFIVCILLVIVSVVTLYITNKKSKEREEQKIQNKEAFEKQLHHAKKQKYAVKQEKAKRLHDVL